MTNNAPPFNWSGASGQSYRYSIFPLGAQFPAKPGNYCFARETTTGRFLPLYFGQTSDLSQRFDSHHKMACAKLRGITHIHVHVNETGENMRRLEEDDLVAKWRPACNG